MSNKYSEYKLVQQCLQEIEDKLGWGSSSSWHNDVFMELSESIHQQTNVLLSATTVKRVWGRISYASAPSISTLNTLSQFAGYVNWRDFKNKAKTKKSTWLSQKIASNIGVIAGAAAFMTLVFISLYSMTGPSNATEIDISSIKFKSQPVTEGLPNSVVFDFDISTIQSDSIFIQQYWDKAKTIRIQNDQQQATGIYYYPGYFRSKLLVEGRILKEHDLFIKSNRWLGTIDYEPVPKYFDGNDLSVNEMLLAEIAASSSHVGSSFHFVKDFGDVSGDHIEIKSKIQNLYQDKWAVCQRFRIVVLGTKGAFSIPFSIPGCVSDLGLMLNERYWNGKEHDLSAFGINTASPRNINISIKDQQVNIAVDDQEIFKDAYKESIGNFVGIRYRFIGAGKVLELVVKDKNGNAILSQNAN